MGISRLLPVSVAALITSTGAAWCGPCTQEIDRMQVRVDAMIAATAATGPSGRESSAATLHHQPTPGSIAAAEEKLGDGGRGVRALAALAQARAADRAGDRGACERALGDARIVLGP